MTDQYLYQNAELPQCPVETTLEVISTRWGALIVRDLLNGPLRYKELQRSLGNISQKVLTENLRQLEALRNPHPHRLRAGAAARGV